MNGAESLARTLVESGVTVCFANPGTSEMHFVEALDKAPEMRPVLTLFEGVATGAADGYARMTGRPAATLLHLGPGLANGLANLHNARRAWVPMVNIVGDHATYHGQCDAPLTSDVAGFARPVSGWIEVGAAVACPDGKVICLTGDGRGMYTLQALWTMAREDLDVTTIVFANRSYKILNVELGRVGAGEPGPLALSMLDLSNPGLDWAGLGRSLGVESSRAETLDQFIDQFEDAMRGHGPRLIEAMI